MEDYKTLYLAHDEVTKKIAAENRRHDETITKLRAEQEQISRKIEMITNSDTTFEVLQIFDKIRIRGDFFAVFDETDYYSFSLNDYLERLQEHIASGSYQRYNIEVQDNAYGGNFQKYLSSVQKNFATNYHPCLFALSIQKLTAEEEDLLLRWIHGVLSGGAIRVNQGKVSNEVFGNFLNYKGVTA